MCEDASANLFKTHLEKTGGERLWAMCISTELHSQTGLLEEAKSQLDTSTSMWSKQSDKTSSPDKRHLCMYLFFTNDHRWTVSEQPVYLGHK